MKVLALFVVVSMLLSGALAAPQPARRADQYCQVGNISFISTDIDDLSLHLVLPYFIIIAL